ncbi:hypothetical protein J2W97_001743 [Paenibacillus jamilae]|nr:hypothetical protein [Paenibacillus jamilae]
MNDEQVATSSMIYTGSVSVPLVLGSYTPVMN